MRILDDSRCVLVGASILHTAGYLCSVHFMDRAMPTESEDIYLRRSIYLCKLENHTEVIDCAFRGSKLGATSIAGQFYESDRTIPLRSLLLQAST